MSDIIEVVVTKEHYDLAKERLAEPFDPNGRLINYTCNCIVAVAIEETLKRKVDGLSATRGWFVGFAFFRVDDVATQIIHEFDNKSLLKLPQTIKLTLENV